MEWYADFCRIAVDMVDIGRQAFDRIAHGSQHFRQFARAATDIEHAHGPGRILCRQQLDNGALIALLRRL